MPDIASTFSPGKWEFTPAVVAQFDNHVRASVPHYDTIQSTVAELSDWLAPDGATVVDLGCSTGETLSKIARRQAGRRLHLYGYDTVGEMLDAARMKITDEAPDVDLILYQTAIEHPLHHRDADLTVSLFTLQFLRPVARAAALRNAYNTTALGGALLIAEKTRPTDPRWFEYAAETSWDYKSAMGIEAEAVLAKARALRGVLRPWTDQQNLDALRAAGWSAATILVRWHQWTLYGAFKDA